MVMGEGKAPDLEHLSALGETADLNKDTIVQILDQTRAALADWPAMAKEHGVTASNARLINGRLGRIK
jgi:serine/threonine-protein kinase HipA